MSLDLELQQPSKAIIQIGVCVGNIESGNVLERAKWHVKIDEVLDPFIIKLTGITQQDVDSAEPLIEVYKKVVDLYQKHQCYTNVVTWGGGDSEILKKQLGKTNIPWIFGHRWLDVKTIFQIFCMRDNNKKTQGGLARAMTKVGLAFQGRKHDAGDDAYNTWRLLVFFVKHLPKNILKK